MKRHSRGPDSGGNGLEADAAAAVSWDVAPDARGWTRWAPLVILAALLAAHSAKADEADDQYAVAAGHYAQQRWKFAAEEFQTFLAKYPSHAKYPTALFYLGEALVQLGRYDEAQQRFQEYLKRDAAGEFARPALFRAGESAYFAGKRAEAKSALGRFAEKYPDDALEGYVLPYLGEIAMAENDAVGAEGFFQKGLARFPEGPLQDDCRYGIARALEKQDRSGEAEKIYLALAGKPASRFAEDAHLRLGAVQYAAGKHAEAAESFAGFEAKWPQSPRLASARLGHGWALMKLGRPAEAAALFQQIASDAKLGIEARYWLGLAQKAQKDWPAAAKTLLATAPSDPKHPLAAAIRFHAGDALLRGGDQSAARQQFDLVLQTAPADSPWIADAMLGIVQAASRQKDYATLDRQAAEFSRRFPKSPLAAEVRQLAARSLVERKEYPKAVEALQPLVAAGTNGESALEAHYLLAVAQEGLKRYPEALAALKPVLASATGPLKADAQFTEASLRIAMKQFGEAIAPLEGFLASQPAGDAGVKARGNLAICYARSKQLDKAKRLYAEVAGAQPPRELLATVTEQLAEAALDAGDTAWSNELFARVAKQGSMPDKQVAGLSGLGWSQFKAGQLEEAATTFGQVLAKNPDPALAAETALARGQVLEKLKRPDGALAMYDLVIERYASSHQMAQALLAAARLRHRLQQDQQAVVLFERLAKEFPKLPEADSALYDWAWALNDLGKLPESSDVFERLRRDFPQSSYWVDATFRLAQRAFVAKDYPRARALVDELLKRKMEASYKENVLCLRAQIAAGEEKWPESRDGFEALIKEFPSGSRRLFAEYGIAEAAFRLGDYEQARERFERLEREAQGRDKSIPAVAMLRQAQALCHEKKWAQAYKIASKIESAHPGFEEQYEADYVVGRCLANQAEFENAREAYRKVIRSREGEKTLTAANAQLMIGETYYHQKNYETALREYHRVDILYAFPGVQAAALLQAGKCHELLGEWKQATEVYTRLTKQYPDTNFSKEAAQRLRTAEKRAAEARNP